MTAYHPAARFTGSRPPKDRLARSPGVDLRSISISQIVGPLSVVSLLYVGFFKAAPFMQWAPLDLTVVCFVVVAVALIINLLVRGSCIRIPVLVAFFVASCIPATLFALTNPVAIEKRLSLIIPLVAALGAAAFVRSHRAQQTWVWLHVLLGIAIAVTATGFSAASTIRFAGAGSNTIGAGRASGVAIVVLLILIFHNGLGRLWTIAGAVLLTGWLTLALISTGSRGPAFACAATVLLVGLISAPRARILRGLAAIGAIAAGWLFLTDATGLGATRISNSVNGRYDITESRGNLWKIAIEAIPTHPIGVGWGNFWALLAPSERLDSGYDQYPHNIILEIFVEAGWLAGVLAIAFVVTSLYRLQRRAHDAYGAARLGIALFFVINAMVSGDVNDNRMMWAALVIGWIVTAASSQSQFHTSIDTEKNTQTLNGPPTQ